MSHRYMFLPVVALLATACSKTSEYSPAADASGEEIFQSACVECHQKENGQIFEFAADKANVAVISKTITEGGMMMPSFPQVQGEALNRVSQYVLDNSKTK